MLKSVGLLNGFSADLSLLGVDEARLKLGNSIMEEVVETAVLAFKGERLL